MRLNSPKKRFTLGLLLSLNIHIALFLCFSPHFNALSFSSPRIIYYQQTATKIAARKISKIKEKKGEKKIDNKKKEVSIDKIEVKKKQEPKKKRRVSRKKVLSERKKEKVAIEQKRQEKTLQERNLISYYQLISEQIKQKAVYPEQARRNLSEGLVYVAFTVLRGGHLKEIEIKISSGNDYLDKAALRSVKGAAPFSPFPPHIKEKQLCLNIPISFEIE